jgi:ribosomal protein S18 acetylase RimI-like enzyme
MDCALDNPFWSSLAGRHARLSQGGALALRYPVDVSPFAGLPQMAPRNLAALEALVGVGEDVGLVGQAPPALSDHWKVLRELKVTQMILSDRALRPEGDVAAAVLGAGDLHQILPLVELTKPGPFRPRTIELGTYLGIREGGRLVAMAGERTWVGDYREVSAVCTHPEVRGRGYARALMGRVINRMLRAGQTPYLHAESENTSAVSMYRKMGFEPRCELWFVMARRVG